MMATLEFPTAATVPFPYASPYNVQRDLMGAILDALHQCRDVNANDESTPRRAPIIMLESPTGTGKSLSLACASMSWLKYCESVDLLPPQEDETSAVYLTKSPNGPDESVTGGNVKKYDWIDAWQPSDQQSNTDQMMPSKSPALIMGNGVC